MKNCMKKQYRHGVVLLELALSVLGFVQSAWSSPSTYELSQTAEMQWPSNLSYTATPLLTFNTVIFEVSNHSEKSKMAKITIIRNKPVLWASFDLIKNSWQRGIRNVASISKDKLWNDQGCKKLDPGRFSCTRTGKNEAGAVVVENMLWNKNQDEILIRTEQSDTPIKVMKLASSIILKFKELKR